MGVDCVLPGLEEAAAEVRSETRLGASWALYRLLRGAIEDAEEGRPLCGCVHRVEEIVHSASPTMVPPRWIPKIIGEACARGESPGEALRRLMDYQSRAQELLVQHALSALRGISTIVTLSNSATIERIAYALPRSTLFVVAESRPGGEGVVLASRIVGSGRQARVVPDSMLAHYLGLGGVAVLLGADAVTGDGCVYNKVGSRLLALAGKAAGTPVYAAFDATKTWPGGKCGSLHVVRWSYSIEGWGTVEVPVFEPVEPALLAGYITEAGVLPAGPGSVAGLAARLLETVL